MMYRARRRYAEVSVLVAWRYEHRTAAAPAAVSQLRACPVAGKSGNWAGERRAGFGRGPAWRHDDHWPGSRNGGCDGNRQAGRA